MNKEEKEFNLSEKIDDSFVSNEDFDFIRTKDVKEFIRQARLKSKWNEEAKEHVITILELLELAGDELK